MKFGLPDSTIESIQKVFETNSKIDEVILFGSRGKGNYKEGSDIDLAVKGRNINLDDILSLSRKLDELNLPYKIDLINYATINDKDVVEHINRVGIEFYSRWKEFKLGNAPLEIIDGDRGKNYPSQQEFTSIGDCLFLSTKNVRINGFDFSDCQFISNERDSILRKGKLQRNDVVLTTRGTIGNIGFYSDAIKYNCIRINSGMVIIRPNTKELLPVYNYYVFKHLQKDFLTFTSGSAQPQLPIKDLNRIDIKLPPLSEQTNIASILSSLDDKIDLLHRQNKP